MTQTVADIMKKPYSYILIPDEGSGSWTGLVAELPGCISQGDTPAETMDNLRDAMEGWLSVVVERGQDVPSPRVNYDSNVKFRELLCEKCSRKRAEEAAAQ